jgi:hypothetical protein
MLCLIFSTSRKNPNSENKSINKIKIEQKQKGKGELNCKYVWLRCLLQVPGTVVGRSVQKKKCVRIIYTYVQFYSVQRSILRTISNIPFDSNPSLFFSNLHQYLAIRSFH